MTAVAGTSLRAAWRSRLGSGMIGIRRPMARPSPKLTPTLSPVNDPGPVATATAVSVLPSIIVWSCVVSACWPRFAYLVTMPTISTPPRSSRSSAAHPLVVAEVSMTKITRCPDQPAVATKVFELDERGVLGGKTLTPFDDHSSRVQQLLEAEVAQLLPSLEPVEIDVGQLHAALVDANELERRACNRRRGTRPSRDASHEGGLPRSQLALEQNQVTFAETASQLLAGGLGLLGSRGLTQSGRSRSHGPAAGCRLHRAPGSTGRR